MKMPIRERDIITNEINGEYIHDAEIIEKRESNEDDE